MLLRMLLMANLYIVVHNFIIIFPYALLFTSSTDAYADRTSVTLPKGHYTIRLQVKHDDASLLESYDSTPMVLERKLDSSVKVPCYATQADALLNTAVSAIPLFLGTSCSVIFGEPSASSLPTSVNAGDVFQGQVTYLKTPANILGSGTRPGGYPITFFCTGGGGKPKSVPAKEKDSSSGTTKVKTADIDANDTSVSEEKTVVFEMDDALREAIRDAKLKYLSDLGGKEITQDVLARDLSQHPFQLAYGSMVGEYPEHVALRLTGLEYLMKCATTCSSRSSITTTVCMNANEETSADNEVKKVNSAGANAAVVIARAHSYLQAAVASADEIFAMIDKVAIMTELGVLVDSNDTAATKQRKKIMAIKDQVSTELI